MWIHFLFLVMKDIKKCSYMWKMIILKFITINSYQSLHINKVKGNILHYHIPVGSIYLETWNINNIIDNHLYSYTVYKYKFTVI